MRLIVNRNCPRCCNHRLEPVFLDLQIGPFRVHWFKQWGERWCYIYWGSRFWRFSTRGYASGRIPKEGMA